jgi:hypothetical protein
VVRRGTLKRGVLPPLLEEWRRREVGLEQFLLDVDVTEDTQTTEMITVPVTLTADEDFGARHAEQTAHTDEKWVYLTLTSDAKRYGLALPVAAFPKPEELPTALYVEVHSRLIAWWLCYAWRTAQLADATAALAAAEQVIPAASCARALLETAAAFWVDARKITNVWKEAKTKGAPTLASDSYESRRAFLSTLTEVQFGGKFSEEAPDAARVFGRQPRANVLGAIKKLAKHYPGDLHTDYQWLCNTVHPSLGTTLVFSAPPMMHDTSAVIQRWFAGVPLRVEADDAFDEKTFVERSIPSSTARCAVAGLHVLAVTMDAALRVLDDIALTTRAPMFAEFTYWRALRQEGRNEPCACRSGRKTKHCDHAWGGQSPFIPSTFEPSQG